MNAMDAIDAIDIDDFVYAATGARLRRLTLPDGTHWFPAVDAARQLGYASARAALRAHVADALHATVAELPIEVKGPRGTRNGLKKSTRMVCLEGLVQLVNASGKAAAGPFRAWVAELVVGVQRDGSYGLDPAPATDGFVLPQPLLDVLVRLEEAALRPDTEWGELLRAAGRDLHRLAESLDRLTLPVQRTGPSPAAEAPGAAPVARTPQELLDSWCARNAVVGPDAHAVAAYLAPALVRGGVRYRLEEVARRTGLTAERVRDCVRTLVERGCMRHAGGTGTDGGLLYALP
ncbi:Bro-N domain-containing protein [Streptomyces sp. NPDC048623]|uniref:BRO-N domain-containing protein n=1 Tax=Streptomyces sp. NPDC048623 TaxID=3155761 RepID=UPI0034212D87